MFVLAPEITPVTHLGLSGREAVTEMSFTQLEIQFCIESHIFVRFKTFAELLETETCCEHGLSASESTGGVRAAAAGS